MDNMQLVIAGAMIAGIGIGAAITWPLAQYFEWKKSKEGQRILLEKELYALNQELNNLVYERDTIIKKYNSI